MEEWTQERLDYWLQGRTGPMLDPETGRPMRCLKALLPISWPSNADWQVEAILDRKREGGKVQYLIKWLDWDDEFNSWEPEENLAGCQELLAEFNEARKTSTAAKRTGTAGAKKKRRVRRKRFTPKPRQKVSSR